MMQASQGKYLHMDVRLSFPSVPPLWREGFFGLEAASLMASPVWRGAGQAPGDGRGVVLIPGFMAGDASLGLMTRWLRGLGYRTHKAGIRSHVDCSATVCRSLVGCLERMADKTGDRVAIVGQSRGGIVARALAVQRPDLISGIVTLGSPVRGTFQVHPMVLASVGVVGTLGSLGTPHLFTWSCLRGSCCREFRAAVGCDDFPQDVGYTAVYSRHDGVVRWRACLDPCAGEHVEVRSSHCGMAVHPDVYTVVGRSLAAFGHVDDMPVWTDWAQAA
jgi:triacylglycerol lipase